MSEAAIGRTIWTACAGERPLYLLVIIGYGNVVSFSYLCLKRALMNPIFIPITLVLWWCCTFYLQEYVLFIYKSMYYLSTRVCTIYLQQDLPFVYKSTVRCVFAQIPRSVYLAAKPPFTTDDITAEAIISTFFQPILWQCCLALWPIHQCWSMSWVLSEAGCCLHKFF